MSMLHPIFSVLIKRPDLVVEHLAGYSALARQEVKTTGKHAVERTLAGLLALVSFAVFLTLAGTAVMLGVMLDHFNWALVLVPGAILLIGIVAGTIAQKPMPPGSFAQLKEQVDADIHALRAAGDNA